MYPKLTNYLVDFVTETCYNEVEIVMKNAAFIIGTAVLIGLAVMILSLLTLAVVDSSIGNETEPTTYIVVHRSGTDTVVADHYCIERGTRAGYLTLLRNRRTAKCYASGTWYSIEPEIKNESQ